MFNSSPGPVRKDWRSAMGTTQATPQMNSSLPHCPTTPVLGMHRNSPELNRNMMVPNSVGKFRSKSSPCESETEIELRDTVSVTCDETEDDLDSASVNRDTSFGQQAPLLVSTTTPISDKIKFYSLSQRQLCNAPVLGRLGVAQQTFNACSNISGFASSDTFEANTVEESGSNPSGASNCTESASDKSKPNDSLSIVFKQRLGRNNLKLGSQ